MIIRYVKGGRIVSCTTEAWSEESDEEAGEAEGKVLSVADEDLPEDFLSTFAVGKYRVSRKKIVERADWARPDAGARSDLEVSIDDMLAELTEPEEG